MNNDPYISIVTVSYNSGDGLANTIESVHRQTYPYIDYIIIDGKSTDGSLKKVDDYKNVISTFVSESDDGIYDAMNKGIAYARGEWLYFLNAGDTFTDPDILFKVAAVIKDTERANTSIFLGNIDCTLDDESLRTVEAKARVSPWYTPPHQGMFIPVKYLKHEKFESSLRFLADRELYIKLVKRHNLIPVLLGFSIARYDMNGISSKGHNALKIYKEGEIINLKYFHGKVGIYVFLRALIKYMLSWLVSDARLIKYRFKK